MEKTLKDGDIVYVVKRCEEHDDYVEKVFIDGAKAEAYCEKFNNDENCYYRQIEETPITL